jgi:hypothetical protein
VYRKSIQLFSTPATLLYGYFFRASYSLKNGAEGIELRYNVVLATPVTMKSPEYAFEFETQTRNVALQHLDGTLQQFF